MSTPQYHEINAMAFDTEYHEICFVARKTFVMTSMSWDFENVMGFIFSWEGGESVITYTSLLWDHMGDMAHQF